MREIQKDTQRTRQRKVEALRERHMQVRGETEGDGEEQTGHAGREERPLAGGRLPSRPPPPDLTSCWERTKILLPTSEGALRPRSTRPGASEGVDGGI